MIDKYSAVMWLLSLQSSSLCAILSHDNQRYVFRKRRFTCFADVWSTERITPRIPNLCTRKRWVVSSNPCHYNPMEGTEVDRRLGGLRAGLYSDADRKILGIEPRASVWLTYILFIYIFLWLQMMESMWQTLWR